MIFSRVENLRSIPRIRSPHPFFFFRRDDDHLRLGVTKCFIPRPDAAHCGPTTAVTPISWTYYPNLKKSQVSHRCDWIRQLFPLRSILRAGLDYLSFHVSYPRLLAFRIKLMRRNYHAKVTFTLKMFAFDFHENFEGFIVIYHIWCFIFHHRHRGTQI